ncbi:hypothetical protein UCD39_15115 [Nitrospirillum sp. BR 11752]|uniref:MotE family protein n=1 Tax=Nitrospirillum sp. BR 11752 TaxID=3104293 RepID=UPI002EB4FF4B|nr:hypothetical protein [Nitrospirillum sp. BR 11752]
MTAEPSAPRQGRPTSAPAAAVPKAPAPSKPALPAARTQRPAPAVGRAGGGKGARGPARAEPKAPFWRRLRIRLLPVTIFAAVLLLGARAGDIWWTLTMGAAPPDVPAAKAQSPSPEKPAPAAQGQTPSKPAEAAAPHAAADAKGEAAKGDAKKGDAAKGDAGKPEPSGSPSDGQSFTPKDVELLQRLAERREALDSRERDLDQREAMLQVATQRLDQKLAEMQALKKQLDGLVNQVNADQAQQLDSLVKIYETMKPAEAARIFEAMDDKVLLNVISRMKEAKTAPVLAAMTPKRAEQVTTMLAERKRLPNVPQ